MTENCEYCDEPLVRKTLTRMRSARLRSYLETLEKFSKRKYCDNFCKNRHMAILWANETYRESMIASFTTPQQRLRKSEITRQQWENGTLRAHNIAVKRRITPNWTGLTEEQIRAIIVDPRRYEEIAKTYQISVSLVSDIKRGIVYRYIENRPKAVINHSRGLGVSRKLSDSDIAAIVADTRIHREIAADYNVSTTTIVNIKKKMLNNA